MAKTKILVVDDELIGRQLLQAVLLPEGFEIFLAENGNEAVDMAKEHQPNLVLMDVMMPGIDGYEAAKKMKSIPGVDNIPIIMVTALDDRDSRIRGLEAGAVDYITKPFDRIEIINKIKNRTSNQSQNISDENNSKTEEISTDSIAEVLLDTMLDVANVNERFSGKIDVSSLEDTHLNVLGQWTYKIANCEYLAFFGQQKPNKLSKQKNCLITAWLWQFNQEQAKEAKDIVIFIQTRMKESGFFNDDPDSYWFVIFMKGSDGIISCNGFNQTAYILSETAHEVTTGQHILDLNKGNLTQIDNNSKAYFFLGDNNSSNNPIIPELLKKNLTQPELFEFNSTHKALFKKAGANYSIGIKVGF